MRNRHPAMEKEWALRATHIQGNKRMRVGSALSRLVAPLLLMTLGGCASETLLQTNFDATPSGQPPAHTQPVGTVDVDGAPGSVVVIDSPAPPSGKWVKITRPGRDSGIAGLQGKFSQFRGEGTYNFSAVLLVPSGSGLATVQFEAFGQAVGDVSSFLHLDFTQDNRVRIDDDEGTKFGTFPRDQPFIVQVTLNITATAQTAHVVLAGAGASGIADYTILPAFRPMAQQFGAIRVWMGFPWTGSFDATNIVVTRSTS